MIPHDDEISLDHHRGHALAAGQPLQLPDEFGVLLEVDLLVLDPILPEVVQQGIRVGAVGTV